MEFGIINYRDEKWRASADILLMLYELGMVNLNMTPFSLQEDKSLATDISMNKYPPSPRKTQRSRRGGRPTRASGSSKRKGMNRIARPPLLTRRGLFSPLDGQAKSSYTGSVKGCADGPRPRITDRTKLKAGTVFHAAVRPPALWMWVHKCSRELCIGLRVRSVSPRRKTLSPWKWSRRYAGTPPLPMCQRDNSKCDKYAQVEPLNGNRLSNVKRLSWRNDGRHVLSHKTAEQLARPALPGAPAFCVRKGKESPGFLFPLLRFLAIHCIIWGTVSGISKEWRSRPCPLST